MESNHYLWIFSPARTDHLRYRPILPTHTSSLDFMLYYASCFGQSKSFGAVQIYIY